MVLSSHLAIYTALICSFYLFRGSKHLFQPIWQGPLTSTHTWFVYSFLSKVDACTIMRDPNGTSRGFAFLTFEDPSAVAAVVAQDHILDGKAVCRVKVILLVLSSFRSIPSERFLAKNIYGTLAIS